MLKICKSNLTSLASQDPISMKLIKIILFYILKSYLHWNNFLYWNYFFTEIIFSQIKIIAMVKYTASQIQLLFRPHRKVFLSLREVYLMMNNLNLLSFFLIWRFFYLFFISTWISIGFHEISIVIYPGPILDIKSYPRSKL